MEHGDFLSAWTARVAERLVAKAMEVLKNPKLAFPMIAHTMARCFDYVLIEEGQKIMQEAARRQHAADPTGRYFVDSNPSGSDDYFKTKFDQAREAKYGRSPIEAARAAIHEAAEKIRAAKKQESAGMVWLWKCPAHPVYNRPDQNYCRECGRPSPAIEAEQLLKGFEAGTLTTSQVRAGFGLPDLEGESIIEGEFTEC